MSPPRPLGVSLFTTSSFPLPSTPGTSSLSVPPPIFLWILWFLEQMKPSQPSSREKLLCLGISPAPSTSLPV